MALKDKTAQNEVIEYIGSYEVRIPRVFKGLEYKRTIGKGTFAVVILCEVISTHEKVACKVCSRELLEKEDVLLKFEQELRILERLHHPNIVQIKSIIYLEKLIIISMEYCSMGELFLKATTNINFEEYLIIHYAQQILSALKYIHSIGVCHRDIKLENIVIDANDNAKLIDFGLCREGAKECLMNTFCGTLAYIPPEVIMYAQYDGKAADIWSLGIAIYVLACGHFPWQQTDEKGIVKEIISGVYSIPYYLSPVLRDLLEKMLVFDPNNRWTAEQLLTLQIFNKKLMIAKPHHMRSYGSTFNLSSEQFFLHSAQKKGIVVRTRKTKNDHIVIEPRASHRLSRLAPNVSYNALPKLNAL